MNIHLVSGQIYYEGATPIKAFQSKAVAFKRSCGSNNQPAGSGRADSYIISGIELVEGQDTALIGVRKYNGA